MRRPFGVAFIRPPGRPEIRYNGTVENALYSFVIVDDEPEIREGIRDNIPWEELGFSFAGACANGNEALELVERSAPDVVMTDINMPFMDGLALCERIAGLAPATKVLIISGYDDFDYARKALQLQVYDFILKPVTPTEFKATLASLKRRLDAERETRRDQERIRRQLEESLPLLRERFLNRLLAGETPAAEAGERLDYFGLSLPSKGACYLAMAAEIEDKGRGEEFELDVIAARNTADAALEGEYRCISFQDQSDRLVFLGWGQAPDSLYRESLKAAELLRSALARTGMETVKIGVGEAVDALALLGRSYQDALRALSFAMLRGKAGVTAYRELVGKIGHERGNPTDWGKAISSALRTASIEDARARIDAMIGSFRAAAFDVEAYHATLRLTLAAIVRTLEDLELSEAEIFRGEGDPFARIRELKSLDEARDWYFDLSDRIVLALRERQESFARAKVREAIDYMAEHYAESDLSLSSLCKELFISTSYFSSIFKKYQERTFVEHLTVLRMDKAKELLRTSGLKTYEVAERVGYSDPHYFSLSFRKFSGTTPTSYRGGTEHGQA